MSVSESAPRSLLHSIQAVRGIFAVLVVCHHVGVHSERHWQHNWLGGVFNQSTFRVDFFFVLSGFVLWAAHRDDAGAPGGWRRFLAKRLLRIYPLLVTLTLAKALVLWLVPGRSLMSFDLLPSLLALPQENFPVIVAAWTLSFEVGFAALFTAALALPRGAVLPALVTWGVLLSGAGFLWGVRPALHGIGFCTHPFVLEFVSGVLMVEWLRRQAGRDPVRNGRLGRLLCAISTVGLAVGATQHDWIISHPVLWQKLFWAVVFSLGLAGLALWERAVAAPDWHLRDALGAGRASYSIFLSHGFVLMGAFVLLQPGSLPFGSAGKDAVLLFLVVLSVLFGLAVWKWLERPLTGWFRLPKNSAPVPVPRGMAARELH